MLGLSALALGTLIVGLKIKYCLKPDENVSSPSPFSPVTKTIVTHPMAPIEPGSQETLDSRKVFQQLSAIYGPQAASFAMRTIQNGTKISRHPQKTAELEKIKWSIMQSYNQRVRPLRLFGYCDDLREAEHIASIYSAISFIRQSGKNYSYYLPIGLILSALSNEGSSLDVDKPGHKNIDGFKNYANDTFGSEFPKIVAVGLLPPDFRSKFTVYNATNEKGIKVVSARFTNKDSALKAATAMVAYNQYLFLNDLRRLNIPINRFSADEIMFYTYIYFNAGPNKLRKTVNLRTEKQFHEYFWNKQNIGFKANAYRVASGARWLEESGAFNQNPGKKYWYD